MNDLPNEVMEEVDVDGNDEGEKARVSPRRRTSNGMNCLYFNVDGDGDGDNDEGDVDDMNMLL